MNKEVIDYILKSREAGQGDAQIKENLLRAGWINENIDKGFNSYIIQNLILKSKEEGLKDKQIIENLINSKYDKNDIYDAYDYLIKKMGFKIMPNYFILRMPLHRLFYRNHIYYFIWPGKSWGIHNPIFPIALPVKTFEGKLFFVISILLIVFWIVIRSSSTISSIKTELSRMSGSNISLQPTQTVITSPISIEVENQNTLKSEQATQKENLEWNQYVHPNFGVTVFYPPDWKTLFNYMSPDSLFFVTNDYEPDKSGARINFIYGLTNNENWQSVISAMYGGRSKNEIIQLNGKSILKTTYDYEAKPEVEALSLPVANGAAFISLFLEPSGKVAGQYTDILEEMIKKIQLPTALSNQWQTYIDEQYGFSFIYPPQTNLQRAEKVISILVRYGFQGHIRISNKLQNESLMEWLNRASSLGPNQSYLEKPTLKIINDYNAIEEEVSDIVGGQKNIYLEKDNLVITFSQSGDFSPSYQKILDSFRFK